MQSELFDNKIKEAADHHHPAYDEQAWKRMEKLLDKHLPREEDNRRRFIFFILLFLLIGGTGGWLLISQPWKKDHGVTAASQKVAPGEKTVSPNKVTPGGANDQNIQSPVANEPDPAVSTGPTGTDQRSPGIKDPSHVTTYSDAQLLTPGHKRRDPLTTAIDRVIDKPGNKKAAVANAAERTPVISEPVNTAPVSAREPSETVNKPVQANQPAMAVKEPAKENITIKTAELPAEQQTPSSKTTTKNKKGERKVNSFFLSFSAGPDISFTGNDNWGHTRLLGGIGAGFIIKDRLMIRAGVYTGRKIYSAEPAAYHPPEAFWTYYPYLEKVEADCKVTEIPLVLSYQFGRSSKGKWMGSAGLSSYLMKEENYNYYYKYYPGSPTYTHKSSIKNENNHYFSVLTLSGGYKRKLGNRVTLMAEPYLKLPLKGVGYGKVKLNSGGVLFTIGVNPFAAKVKSPSTR